MARTTSGSDWPKSPRRVAKAQPSTPTKSQPTNIIKFPRSTRAAPDPPSCFPSARKHSKEEKAEVFVICIDDLPEIPDEDEEKPAAYPVPPISPSLPRTARSRRESFGPFCPASSSVPKVSTSELLKQYRKGPRPTSFARITLASVPEHEELTLVTARTFGYSNALAMSRTKSHPPRLPRSLRGVVENVPPTTKDAPHASNGYSRGVRKVSHSW